MRTREKQSGRRTTIIKVIAMALATLFPAVMMVVKDGEGGASGGGAE